MTPAHSGRHGAFQHPPIVGESRGMVHLQGLVAQLAPTPLAVLVTGETGTGKELVARALHAASGRRGEFVVVNCAAVSEGVFESELFGHKRGAFTGAVGDREGLISAAANGTLFLDEVGDTPREQQPKLLRAVELGEYRVVGETRSRSVDVRVVAATNRDLTVDVQEGRFRRDLYVRLRQVDVALPPLRARTGDVRLLVQYFLAREGVEPSRLAPQVMPLLEAYPWPGNVRELGNAVSRAVALSSGGMIHPRHLPGEISEHARLSDAGLSETLSWPALSKLEKVEKAHVRFVWEHTGRSTADAAEILGMHRRTLERKLRRWGW